MENELIDRAVQACGLSPSVSREAIQGHIGVWRAALNMGRVDLERHRSEKSDLLTSLEGNKGDLRESLGQLDRLKSLGLTDDDEAIRKLALKISGLVTSIRLGESSGLSNINAQVSYYEKLCAQCEAKIKRIETLRDLEKKRGVKL